MIINNLIKKPLNLIKENWKKKPVKSINKKSLNLDKKLRKKNQKIFNKIINKIIITKKSFNLKKY